MLHSAGEDLPALNCSSLSTQKQLRGKHECPDPETTQPEENNDDNPVFHLEIMKDRFAPVPKTVKPLYRVGNRLLSSDEWNAYNKMNKGQRE